jgi:integrase
MCCYTGLRRSDIWRLSPNHISKELITITTQKTSITCYIPFYDDQIFRPVELINKYKGRYKTCLPVNKSINEYLKYVQKLSGIDRLELTTKIGRKTFVTLKVYQGVQVRLIMTATGHKTEASFNRYAGIDTESLIQVFKDKSI